jgi:hypothetical protein
MASEKPINLADALRKALAAAGEAKGYTPKAFDAGGSAWVCLEELELLLLAAIHYEASAREGSPAIVMERIAKALESIAGELGSIAGPGIAVKVKP